VTHRLDVATEGVMVLAKTAAFTSVFNRELAGRRVTKSYRTLR
jgi:23S rRNA-/tRNA-specific pseudouridylate synthase